MITLFVILLVYLVHKYEAIWVTVGLKEQDINQIFLNARNRGRSNAGQMFEWKEEMKSGICRNILTSNSLVNTGIYFIDKDDTLNAQRIHQQNPKLFNDHYNLHDEGAFVDPIYPVAPKNVLIGDDQVEVFGFPCLVKTDDKQIEEVYIADGYLEKTYTLLIPVSTFIEDDDEDEEEEEEEEEGVGGRKKRTSYTIMGFAELSPVRKDVDDKKTLEKLYYASLEFTQVETFLKWDEDKALINPIQALRRGEKMKLCSLVFESIYLDFGWEIPAGPFKIENFEHGPITFLTLKKKPPEVEPKHQIIRGIVCNATGENAPISFILIPDWLNKENVFVVMHSNDVLPAPIISRVPSSPEPAKSSRRSTKQSGGSSSATQLMKTVETVQDKIAVVLLSYIEKVSFLMNKKNGTHVEI